MSLQCPEIGDAAFVHSDELHFARFLEGLVLGRQLKSEFVRVVVKGYEGAALCPGRIIVRCAGAGQVLKVDMAAKIGLSLYESPLSERHRPAGVLLAHWLAEGVILAQVQVGDG